MPKADSFDITLKTDELLRDYVEGESCMRHVDVQFLAEGTHTYAHFKGKYQRDWWRTDEHVAKQDGNRKWNEELISVINSVVL